MGKQWKQWLTIFGGSKIIADGDWSHEIQRQLLLGRKVMTNLDSILKSRDITVPTKVCLVKAMVFPVVMYGCESWTVKKSEHWRIDGFELWCWRRLLRVPWTARSPTSQPKRKSVLSIHWNSQLHAEAETPILWPPDVKNWLIGKDPDARRLKAEEGDNRGWDGWMAAPTRWTWVWASSGGWWWTEKPGMLQSKGSQRVGHE